MELTFSLAELHGTWDWSPFRNPGLILAAKFYEPIIHLGSKKKNN